MVFKTVKAGVYLRSVFLLPALIACVYKLSFETLTARNWVFVFERKAEKLMVGRPALEAGTLGKTAYPCSHRALMKSQI